MSNDASRKDVLGAKDYYILAQTRNKKSGTGKNSSELDIEIRESTDTPWAIYEALNITDFAQTNKDKRNEPLVQLLDNYNPVGYPFLSLVKISSFNHSKYSATA